MTQTSPIEPFDQNSAVADYRQQAREFLVKSRQYLAGDDLHQASEKGWGAAAWMAKAVAEAQGWKYTRHDEFVDVMHRAQQLSGDQRLAAWIESGPESANPELATAISTPEGTFPALGRYRRRTGPNGDSAGHPGTDIDQPN